MTTGQGTLATSATDGAGHPGPIPHHRRSLAPDLARGAMLLFIALANVVGYLYGREFGYGHRPVDGDTVDRVTDGVGTLFVAERSYPMFAILLGFGIATMVRRMAERGVDERAIRRVLARRGGWLVAFGLVHAALLYDGDILAPYGVTSLVALFLVRRRGAVLLRWFVPSLLTMTAFFVLNGYLATESGEPTVFRDYLRSVVVRLFESAFVTVLAGVSVSYLFLVITGFLVARAGWLDRPEQHVRTLRLVVLAGLVVNLVGGLPHTLAVARVVEPSRPVGIAFATAHQLSGCVMGLGYVCLFALLAARLGAAGRAGVVAGVAAVGERSLTCYLLQSMVFAPLLSGWGLGLGERIGTTQAYALALGVWLVTVLVAVLLARAGRRGPFEVLLRRLSYGRRVTPAGPVPGAALPAVSSNA